MATSTLEHLRVFQDILSSNTFEYLSVSYYNKACPFSFFFLIYCGAFTVQSTFLLHIPVCLGHAIDVRKDITLIHYYPQGLIGIVTFILRSQFCVNFNKALMRNDYRTGHSCLSSVGVLLKLWRRNSPGGSHAGFRTKSDPRA